MIADEQLAQRAVSEAAVAANVGEARAGEVEGDARAAIRKPVAI